MSEEEKQAIKWFDTERKLVEITNGDNNYFSIILNLIDTLQKENKELKEDLFLEKSKLNDVLKCLLDFIPQNIHEVELKTKILNIIRGDNND